MDELCQVIEAGLPRPDRSVYALIPYSRGDLVARIHTDGEVLSEDHTGDGTLISARVRSDLAAALAEFATA
jgi:GTP-binding protein HflX